jgi:hypothetical protein
MKPFSINKKLTKLIYLAIIFLVAIALAFVGQQMMEPDRVNYVTVETNFASVKEPIKPIPLEIKLNEQKVALGKNCLRIKAYLEMGKFPALAVITYRWGEWIENVYLKALTVN